MPASTHAATPDGMFPKFANRFRIAKVLTIVAVMGAHLGHVRAAAIHTGIEDILWPAIVVAAPFVFVHDLIFGSDRQAFESTGKESKAILDAQTMPLPVRGLYVGPLPLRHALQGMLTESRLPFVEIDTAGSQWLFEEAESIVGLAEAARGRPYIRLSLGEQGHPSCFTWKNKQADWTRQIPVKPGTCLLHEFEDSLQSDLQVAVNTRQLSQRELRWDLTVRDTGKLLLSVPFWMTQYKGKALNADPHHQSRNGSSAFSQLMQKLQPVEEPAEGQNPSRVLRWNDPTVPFSEREIPAQQMAAHVRQPLLAWQPRLALHERWEEGYRRAHDSGKLTLLVNSTVLILPREGKVSTKWPVEHGLKVLRDDAMFTLHASGSYTWKNVHSGMSVWVHGHRFNGKNFLRLRLTPGALPQEHAVCADLNTRCSFYPSDIKITETELVLLGRFTQSGHGFGEWLEWAIPLSQVPSLVTTAP